MQERLATRHRTQPNEPSSGSVFRNPAGTSAWALIDQAGFRGRTCGGAQVSPMHTNFIINRGGATAAEVLTLIREIQHAVLRDTGRHLELEVELVGEW